MSSNPPTDLTKEPINAIRPTRWVEPNNIVYTDGDGVKRSIYLPQGTLKKASDDLENKRWDELAKYEPYVDQGYKESDYKTIEPTSGEAAETSQDNQTTR